MVGFKNLNEKNTFLGKKIVWQPLSAISCLKEKTLEMEEMNLSSDDEFLPDYYLLKNSKC